MIARARERATSWAWTELLHAEVAYALRQADIPVLHIKGPTVALWLYEVGERRWGDVDILVPPDRMHQALAVLRSRGLAEVNPGVNRQTSADHAIPMRRSDPAAGGDDVDVHDRFEGVDRDPAATFAELWRRREPAQLAHSEVWFPDLPSRALLVAVNAARGGGSPQSREDLARLLDRTTAVEWELILDLAGRLDALSALRAGLELLPAGRELVSATQLREVAVSPEWRLRVSAAPRTALRLEELSRLPWAQRPNVVWRWLFPPAAVMRMRDPRAAGPVPVLALAHLRRLRDGALSVPHSLIELRRSRRS